MAIGLLFLSLIVFFYPVIFGGKTFLGPDTLASHSFDTFLAEARSEGIFPLWNPYIFCGMPSYGSLTAGGERGFDLTGYVFGKIVLAFHYLLFAPPVGWVLFYYLVFAGGVYVFTYRKVGDKLAAFVSALAATFSMYIIIWVMTGHNTKISVMAFFPWVFLIVENLRERFDWRLFLVLVVGLHFTYLPSHVQMIFYVYLALGIYLLFFLVRNLVKKEDWKGVVRAGVALAAASVIAFAMDSDKYLSVLEYNPYSIRGSGPITEAAIPGSKSASGGLDYNYATSWSLSPGEVISFVVPFWKGFGSHMYQGALTQNVPTRVNSYFGPQTFTDGAQYIGFVVFALAVVGFVRNRKDPFVQYIAILMGFSLLVAFGKEFPLVYDLMYYYFPFFNKFRIPSMILVLIQIFIPVLAGYGIASFLKQRAENKHGDIQKTKKMVIRSVALVALTCVILSFSYESFLSKQDMQNMASSLYGLGLPKDRLIEQAFQQIPQEVFRLLKEHVVTMVTTDLYVGLALLIVAFGAFLLYLENRLSLNTLAGVLVIVVLVDLWRIDYKPMHPEDRQQQATIFAAPDHVQFIQKDSSLFRVLQFVGGQPPYDNTLAYWKVQNAYGYQGAKMRSYQDVVEVVGLYNPLLWQLMNVKYIFNDQTDSSGAVSLVYSGRQAKVYTAREFLPRAFFVNRYQVATGLDILNKIRSLEFEPQDVAYMLEDPKIEIAPPQPDARAAYVRNGLHGFELDVNATGDNLLFLSETYYPVGWKAFIDGKETAIYRLNYLFRGVVVPPGRHKVEMQFEPRGFSLGKNLSLAANVIVIVAFGYFGVDYFRIRKKNNTG
ncbi:MAG: YfhO family protein [Bacteroidota bacterium]